MSSSSGWLSDTTANKIKHSYINGFLDVSGETITRGANTVYQSGDYDWNAYGQVISGNYESDNEVYFGTSIGMDVSGLTFVAGAHFQDGANTSNTNDGAATVYRYDTTAEIWYQLGNTITGETNNSSFGINADMNDAGTRIMVVDPVANFVNVYDYNASTNNWDKQVSITAHELQQFMGRISGDGNTIVFGNYADNSNRGKQYVYRNTSGTTWTKIGEFTGAHTNAYAGIATSITYDGNRITFPEIDYNFDADGNSSADNGRVTIYDYSGSGTSWNQVGDPIYGTFTGAKLAASMDFSKDGSIIAFSSNVNHHVKVYQYDVSVDGSWKQLGTTIRGSAQQFGYSIRLSDDGTVLVVADMFDSTVGDDYGALYIHKYTNGDWVKQGSTLYGLYTGGGQYPGGSLGGDYGRGIEISGDGTKIIASGNSADVNGTDSGYIKAWQWSQKTFTKPMMNISNQTMTVWGGGEHKLSGYSVEQFGRELDPSEHDAFGVTMDMSTDGTVWAVGRQYSTQGVVYIFRYRPTISNYWVQEARFYGAGGEAYFGTNNKGIAVSGDGNVVVVAAASNQLYFGTTRTYGYINTYKYVNGEWVIFGELSGYAVPISIAPPNNTSSGRIYTCATNEDGTLVAFSSQNHPNQGGIWRYNSTNDVWEEEHRFNVNTNGVGMSLDGTRIALASGGMLALEYNSNNGTWSQLGSKFIEDGLGYRVTISGDGSTIAVTSTIEYVSPARTSYVKIYRYSSVKGDWVSLGTDLISSIGGDRYGASVTLDNTGTLLSLAGYNNSTYGELFKYIDGNWQLLSRKDILYAQSSACISGDGKFWGIGMYDSKNGKARAYRIIANNPALTIGSGNVGIGTDNAISTLDVNGATFLRNQTLTFESGGGGGAATEEVALVFNQASTNRTLALKTDSNGNLSGTIGGGGTRQTRWQLGAEQAPSYFLNNNVGIGTSSPAAKLHIYNSSSSFTEMYIGEAAANDKTSIIKYYLGDGTGTGRLLLGHWGDNLNTTGLSIIKGGNIGIGTGSPSYPLHVVGVSSSTFESANIRYFRWSLAMSFSSSSIANMGFVSILAAGSIGSNTWIFSYSDKRIKKDIVEINDDSALQQIRLLKPSSYKYRDPIGKNEYGVVDGFIAQEVKEVMPRAVKLETGDIPNVMLMGSGLTDASGNHIITIPDYDTSTLELDASGNIFPKLKIVIDEDEKDKELFVNIQEVISTTELKVELIDDDISELPSEIFIYGQEVDNKHALIKERIFTTGISALQEVDRQLQAEKTKTATLETKVATLETENSTLKTQITDILARLSALESG